MSEVLTFEKLKAAVSDGSVDTVLACLVDMQGRLMGKRFVARHFVDSAWEETHCCDYLLATDLEMATPDGYASTSWQSGYGDYVMKPDLNTLRPVPWLEGTAMVLCDILDHHTHEEVAHSPRAVLKKQVARLEAMGLVAMMATELEFFLFEKSFDEIRKEGFRSLEPISGYNQDYHILQTTKEEDIMRPVRNYLVAAGVPVENSKGEAEDRSGRTQHQVCSGSGNGGPSHHRQACSQGNRLAKRAGGDVFCQNGVTTRSAPHRTSTNRFGKTANRHFFDANDELGMSALMRNYLAGLLKYAVDSTYFLAPYVNSYKRFQKGTFAPTRIIWSVDNRTAGFRLCGDGTEAVRVECRIGGSDINPYLALAAQIAAGVKGIEEALELVPPAKGDAYGGSSGMIPQNLRDAREALEGSAMLREAFGDEVIDHYCRAAGWELEEFDRVVTDYEVARGFERS